MKKALKFLLTPEKRLELKTHSRYVVIDPDKGDQNFDSEVQMMNLSTLKRLNAMRRKIDSNNDPSLAS